MKKEIIKGPSRKEFITHEKQAIESFKDMKFLKEDFRKQKKNDKFVKANESVSLTTIRKSVMNNIIHGIET